MTEYTSHKWFMNPRSAPPRGFLFRGRDARPGPGARSRRRDRHGLDLAGQVAVELGVQFDVLLLVPLKLFGPFLGVARGGVGHGKYSDGRLSDLRPRERIGEGPPLLRRLRARRAGHRRRATPAPPSRGAPGLMAARRVSSGLFEGSFGRVSLACSKASWPACTASVTNGGPRSERFSRPSPKSRPATPTH